MDIWTSAVLKMPTWALKESVNRMDKMIEEKQGELDSLKQNRAVILDEIEKRELKKK